MNWRVLLPMGDGTGKWGWSGDSYPFDSKQACMDGEKANDPFIGQINRTRIREWLKFAAVALVVLFAATIPIMSVRRRAAV